MKILNNIKKINDMKAKKINNILDPKKKYRLDFFKTNKMKRIGIYDNTKLIISGEYNFYGIYQQKTGLWMWASIIPGININHIKTIKKIKNSDYLFEGSSDVKINFYYQLLTQDSIYITDSKMLTWINELILYLSDDVYYFNPVNSDSNIQFITLNSIKEQYN
jgi:hypothetical protein